MMSTVTLCGACIDLLSQLFNPTGIARKESDVTVVPDLLLGVIVVDPHELL